MSTPTPPSWLQFASGEHVSNAAVTIGAHVLAVEEVGEVVGLRRDREGNKGGEGDSGDKGEHDADGRNMDEKVGGGRVVAMSGGWMTNLCTLATLLYLAESAVLVSLGASPP
jgi:hypothetical protein